MGALLIAGGLWLIAPPAAIIALGIMFAFHGFLSELRNINEKESADARSRESAASDDSTRYTGT